MNDDAITYEPNAEQSTLPIRKAAAIVVLNAQDNMLVVRRSEFVDEFKGVWSFPSVFIDEHENNICKTMSERLNDWLALEVTGKTLVNKRMGLRPQWRLLMYLFSARQANEPVIQTVKYDAFKWVDSKTYFRDTDHENLGDCAKSYIEYLNRLALL